MVFTPEHPRLYTLNAAAWLVLELCDGRDLGSLEAAYRAALEADATDPEPAAELQATLADFERKGIVGRVAA
jgi:hypothetical protein